MLEPFGEDIWIAPGATVESAGFRYPTRMAVIRLASGDLFLWSPVPLNEALRAEIDALGRVRFLVTPTAMHHVALPDWKRAYPDAALYAAPGSRARRKDIAFDADLADTPPPEWRTEIDQAAVHGNAIATEIVFFHRKSGVTLFADLLQNFPADWFSGWRAFIARLDGMMAPTPQTPRKFRIAFTNRKAARQALAKILSWPTQKVLMAHGDPIHRDGQNYLDRAFKWLSE